MILFDWLIDLFLNVKLNLRTSPIHERIIQTSFVIWINRFFEILDSKEGFVQELEIINSRYSWRCQEEL